MRRWIVLLFMAGLPAGAALAAPEAVVRTVPVTLVTNEAFRGRSGWRGTARWAIEEGTADLAELAGLRFLVSEERTWEPPSLDLSLEQLLDEGLQAVGHTEGLCVFLLAGKPLSPHWGGEAGYALLGRPALALDPSSPAPLGLDQKRALALLFRHELGHVFGVPHLPPSDVMAEDAERRGWDYGGIAAEILRATHGIDFAARTPFAGCDLDLLSDLYHALAVWGDMEPSLLVNLGVAFHTARRDSSARRAYEEAVRLDPESLHARLGLAQSAAAVGDTATARTIAETLSARKDLTPDLLGALGGLWFDLGDLPRAEHVLSEAVARDPTRFTPRFRLALLYFRTDRFADARTHFEGALRIEERPEAWFNVGLCCDALEDREGAAGAFRRYLELAPEGPQAAQARKFLERLGQ